MSKGFSLVELVVTTGIVSIMAGMGVAQFEEFRGVAYESRAYLQMKNAHTAFAAYFIDNPDMNFGGVSLQISPNGTALGARDGVYIPDPTIQTVLPGFSHDRDAGVAVLIVIRGNLTGWYVQRGGSVDIATATCKGKTYGTSGTSLLKKRFNYWTLPELDMQREWITSQALNCNSESFYIF